MDSWNRNNQKYIHQLEVEKHVAMMKNYEITSEGQKWFNTRNKAIFPVIICLKSKDSHA